MMVVTRKISTNTRGDGHTVDITTEVEKVIREAGVGSGVVTLFVVGSTAGLTTIEFEPGAVADLGRVFEKLAPRDAEYQHELRWHDDNGHSHVRAALLGPSLSVPFVSGKLVLGTWQQIVVVDFDTRPRKREVVAQILGE
ncbi:MAG: secondary thiamine-phosphate synthase enzyme YjbQ [Chloroflexota bacterium]|nr:secondary thiamine-phosphate synthase enzyme YjbQ [Chloroflexota bacterium]